MQRPAGGGGGGGGGGDAGEVDVDALVVVMEDDGVDEADVETQAALIARTFVREAVWIDQWIQALAQHEHEHEHEHARDSGGAVTSRSAARSPPSPSSSPPPPPSTLQTSASAFSQYDASEWATSSSSSSVPAANAPVATSTATAATAPAPASGATAAEMLAQQIVLTLEKYQEQGELLDPHLEAWIQRLFRVVHAALRDVDASPSPSPSSSSRSLSLLHAVCRILYALAKVRGYKTIVNFFPHQVADLEPTLALLNSLASAPTAVWQTRYILFLWLSILVLIPFDLATVDSSFVQQQQSRNNVDQAPTGLIRTLISLGQLYLADTGATRGVAALMLAKLFSRPDMDASYLDEHLHWSVRTCAAPKTSAFLTVGVMRSLVEIFKLAPRAVVHSKLHILYDPFVVQRDWLSHAGVSLRQLSIKLTQRMALTYLKPRVATWRYQRGFRSLLDTLASLPAAKSASTTTAMVAQPQPSPATQATIANRDESVAHTDSIDVDIPLQIDDIIQQLLDGLRDADTVVRWSSAKGIGRITMNLPAAFADDVVEAVLDLFSGRESDSAWHGGCLALAELARRGLLLPSRLDAVVPLTCKALVYDVRTGTHSVGAHVRDAACYVVWAFARAYAPEVMSPHVTVLATTLLTLCVYDREVNVRRAAAAAFQENVGRQAGQFPHGIEINTIADYFTVSVRSHAYLDIAVRIAAFPEYTLPFIEHLVNIKSKHWSKDIRDLSARAVHRLCGVSHAVPFLKEAALPALLQSAFSDDISERHGQLVMLAELLTAFGARESLSAQASAEILALLPALHKRGLLASRTSTLMRLALCQLVRSFTAGMFTASAFSNELVEFVFAQLGENVQHLTEQVQQVAVEAMCAWIALLLDDDASRLPEPPSVASATSTASAPARSASAVGVRIVHDSLLRWRREVFSSQLLGANRGFALLLGSLPLRAYLDGAPISARANALSTRTHDVLACLICASSYLYHPDPEARRNACQSLLTFAEQLGPRIAEPLPELSLRAYSVIPAQAKQFKGRSVLAASASLGDRICDHIGAALLSALDDYATDNRGDVGSWVREAAMRGLERLITLMMSREVGGDGARAGADASAALAAHIPAALVLRVFQGLVKQLFEKIDRVREVAGSTLQRLLCASDPRVPHVPDEQALLRIVQSASSGAASSAADADGNRQDDHAVAETTDDAGARVGHCAAADWSSASVTFPLLSSFLDLPAFTYSTLSGLVVSVGGLTESVVRSSSEALHAYVQRVFEQHQDDDGKRVEVLERLASSLLQILTEHRGHSRVVIPTMKTLELLLTNGYFDELTPDRSSFAPTLLQRVQREVGASTNIQKILAALPVFVALLTFEPLRRTVYSVLIDQMLVHQFPKVRRLAAEAWYTRLISGEELGVPVDERDEYGADERATRDDDDATISDDIAAMLSETTWDTASPVVLRTRTNQLRQLLGVPPAPASQPPSSSERARTTASSSSSTSASASASGIQSSSTASSAASSSEYDALVRMSGY